MKTFDITEVIHFDPARPTTKALIDTEKARVVLFCLETGQEVPAHGSDSEVIFYTVQGRGIATVADSEIELRPGIVVHCPPNVQHGLKGKDGLAVVAVIAPRPW